MKARKGKRNKPDGTLVAPKLGEPTKKNVKDKPYCWCPKTADKCKGRGINKPAAQAKELG